MKREPAYVGIDVAKDRVDIAVRPTGQSWSAVLRGRGGGETGCQVAGEPSATIRPSGARNSRVRGHSRSQRPPLLRQGLVGHAIV